MDQGKNKADVRHIASQPFSPSLSKRFFSLPLPSIQMSSINSYPNGTPVNNRGQALEMWVGLKLISREYYLVQQFFVNYSLKLQLTARQLRISKGETMGRMTYVNDRTAISHVLPENAYEYIYQHVGVKAHKGLSLLCSSAYD